MQIIKKYIYLISFIILLIGAIFLFIIKKNLQDNSVVTIQEELEPVKEETSEEETYTVDIKGAVQKPGVYKVPKSYVINDVINEAGGLNKNADTSLTNLSKKITNEMVIIIYTKEEVKKSNVKDTVIKVVEKECVCPNIQNDGCINTGITDTITNQETTLVNINTATQEELMTIPGIGESKAKAIIEYRKQHNFTTIEDIMNVSGIGNALYESIKIYITT